VDNREQVRHATPFPHCRGGAPNGTIELRIIAPAPEQGASAEWQALLSQGMNG
jgi:hypothetical protein